MTTEERLGRIDQRLERLEHELLGNGQPGRCANHARRLAKLELWRSGIVGVVSLLGALLGAGLLMPMIRAALGHQ